MDTGGPKSALVGRSGAAATVGSCMRILCKHVYAIYFLISTVSLESPRLSNI